MTYEKLLKKHSDKVRPFFRHLDKKGLLFYYNGLDNDAAADDFLIRLKENITYAAFEKGKIVSMVTLDKCKHYKRAEVYWVTNRYYRRKGIATKLHNLIETEARKQKIKALTVGRVDPANIKSIEFARSLGYRRTNKPTYPLAFFRLDLV